MFRETPLEVYDAGALRVTVKREDLCPLPGSGLPPLAKCRGVLRHLRRFLSPGDLVGVIDTRVSKSGLGVAACCAALGLRLRYYFPWTKEERANGSWRTEPRMAAEGLGAELVPLQARRFGMVSARAKKDCLSRGGTFLPPGLPLWETVEETAKVVASIPRSTLSGRILVPTGTGTILSGVILGLLETGVVPEALVGVSGAMDPARQEGTVRGHLREGLRLASPSRLDLAARVLSRLRLLRGEGDYYSPSTSVPPWPAHRHYEGKAWDWLLGSSGWTGDGVLFYSVGS